ncbi:hypothetical protein OWR29_25410 [Actinoplanes sp. Pm04-4]|uniref:Uncharacterized protein n=1 Tax=Paractinoplanes pyxinae TaxID=2997416 RepID=A0ABT4B4E5_9ACTN|nr:hypothetical protein [Actinoplanes pyxinae]MCY1141350.1 hypothetical protein [Actinoplanes pyxinae]
MSNVALVILGLLLIVALVLVIAQAQANRISETFVLNSIDGGREVQQQLADRPAPPVDEPSTGRHHTGEVQLVSPDWTPHIGRRLLARETQTQPITWPLPKESETTR